MGKRILSILSIDFDYAFSPVISTYDDFIEGSRISLEEQRAIITQKKLPRPQVNPQKLLYLQKIYKQAQNQGCQSIATGLHHHEILQHLDGDGFHIINIDHHHDIFYPGWHDISVLDEGNWVHWLAKQGKLESYTWVRNSDSENLDPSVSIQFPYVETEWLDPVNLPPIDSIFLCSSPHWTGTFSIPFS